MAFGWIPLLSLIAAFVFLNTVAGDRISWRAEEVPFSTFIYPTDNGNITFSLNAAKSTGDVSFHLSAPATYQWVGVGTGEEMDGSVMWLVYESSEKNGITLSPRISTGHVEPSFSNDINCEMVTGATLQNGVVMIGNTRYYSANVHCKNITTFGKGEGKLDLTKTKQSFMYAWGPTNKALSTTDKAAGIRRHESYGNFWMDMTKAISTEAEDATLPSGASLLTTTNAGADEKAQDDGDKVGPAHAVLMLGSFALIFPLGAVMLRLLESVKIHGIVQGVGMIAALIGVGVGLYLGRMYNHSKQVSSGHQIFGLILLILVFVQWGIGFYNHIQYRKYKTPTKFGKVHLYAGPGIVLGGVINGFTGFNFSSDAHNNIIYGIVVAVILMIVTGLLGWKRWTKRRQTKRAERSDMRHEDSSSDVIGLNVMPGSYNQI